MILILTVSSLMLYDVSFRSTHNALCHRQTDGRTVIVVTIADHTAPAIGLRSAINKPSMSSNHRK